MHGPSSGKHYSLPFLPATPSSPSQTFEGHFELTQLPSRALNSPRALLPELQRYKDTVICAKLGHTCLEAPIGVRKFAKDTNPLGPSGGSIQSILGHFWNFATTGFRDLSWFSSRKSVFMPKHVFKGLKSQNDSLECCFEWKNAHFLQVWCHFDHNCWFWLFAANTRGKHKVKDSKNHNCKQN